MALALLLVALLWFVSALIGAVMIWVIRNALNLLDVDVFFQMIAIGLIIVAAVEADVLRNYLESRARSLQAAGNP